MTESEIKLLEDHAECLMHQKEPDSKRYKIGNALNHLVELYKHESGKE